MHKSILIICILWIWLCNLPDCAQSQDLAFSQYEQTPFLNNPALIARYAHIRVFLNYRNQPLESGDQFTTPMASIIYPFFRKDSSLVRAGLGLSFIHDNQTDFLQTDGALLAFAYNLNARRYHINFGLQAGFFQKRIDLNNAITSSQIVNGLDDPASQENINFPNINYLTLGGGIHWTLFNQWSRPRAFLGLSVQNLNEPNIAFSDGINNPLPQNITATGGVHLYSQNDRFSITPNVRWINRLNFNYILAGSWFNFNLDKVPNYQADKKIQFGTWYHSNQALVMAANYEEPKFFASLSYDLPTANQTSNWLGNGAIEVTLGIKIYKRKKKDPIPPVAPIQDTIIEPQAPIDVPRDTNAPAPPIAENPPIEVINLTDTIVLEDEYEQIEFAPTTVRFTLSKEEPAPTSKRVLDYLARLLKTYPGTVIEVTGYTCNLGDQDSNQALSERRAQAVKNYLISQGVIPGNIITIGQGENNPIAPNDTEFGRQRNRRVVVKPIPQDRP